jgi:type II restriction/modification system DNA methylase subunit YeeA
MAWSDEPWVLDGANVNVSFLAYDDGSEPTRTLNGEVVAAINANLTAGVNLGLAQRLPENAGVAFMGDTKGGRFDIPEALALELLAAPNPDGRSNADVVRPWVNGLDITRRPRRMWIIDFGVSMAITEAAKYEAPFQYVLEHVKPERATNKRAAYAERWWLHVEPRSGMRTALAGLPRYLATPRLTKHRLFVWLTPDILPDSQLIVLARDDDYTLGVLHSRPHQLWSLATGTQLETRPRYTPTTTFETFPFPEPTDTQRQTIGLAAAELDRLRNGWLNPEGLEPEKLELRTLTNLYNLRPAWLEQAHGALDQAVFGAYGWPADVSDDDIPTRLFELNLVRA